VLLVKESRIAQESLNAEMDFIWKLGRALAPPDLRQTRSPHHNPLTLKREESEPRRAVNFRTPREECKALSHIKPFRTALAALVFLYGLSRGNKHRRARAGRQPHDGRYYETLAVKAYSRRTTRPSSKT
jgi:hypothetical protein